MFFGFVIVLIGMRPSWAEVNCAAIEYILTSGDTDYTHAEPLNVCLGNELNGDETGLVWYCDGNEAKMLQFSNKECKGDPLLTYDFAEFIPDAMQVTVYCDKTPCKYIQQTSIVTSNEDCENPESITRTAKGGVSAEISGYCFGAGFKWSCDGDKITIDSHSAEDCSDDPWNSIEFTSSPDISCGVDGNSTGSKPYIMECGAADWERTDDAAHFMYHIYVMVYAVLAAIYFF